MKRNFDIGVHVPADQIILILELSIDTATINLTNKKLRISQLK
jgi:hypothetical protein